MNLKELSKEFNYLNESKFQVGDIVVPNIGAHKGIRHTIIHDFRDGRYNIQPIGLRPNQIQYRLGAASANEDQLEKVSSGLQQVAPSVMDTSGMSTADVAKALGDMTKKKGLRPNEDIDEGTCGYSVDGKPADKPSGPHLIRKAIKEEIKKLKEGLDSKSFDMIQTIADKYSYGEILDALESFYIKNDEQNSARMASIHAKEFRRVLNMPNPFKK